MAFKIAVDAQGHREESAPGPVEPIMKVEVVAPRSTWVHHRRRHSRRAASRRWGAPGTQVITTAVPLSEMFGYATELRSMTQGRATYTMHFLRYEEAPKSVSEEVIAKVQGIAR